METAEVNQVKTLGDWAYLAVEKHFHKILKHEDDVLKDKDPEALHQMRVGMRRLRSAVSGFAPALELPKAAQEKKIAKVARILGELRDLDVLKEALEKQYQPMLPHSEQKSLEKVLDYLKSERKQALSQVRSVLEHKHYKNLKLCLKRWLKQPSYLELARVPIRNVLPDLLLPSASKLFLHPGWLVGVEVEAEQSAFTSDLSQAKVAELLAAKGMVLHSLRKEAKRSRYQMELFTDFYSKNYEAYVEDVKEIQRILGEMQDCFVLGEFLTDALDSDIKKRLPTLVDKLEHARYQAWQDWQPLQQKYHYLETRQAFHLELLKPIFDNK